MQERHAFTHGDHGRSVGRSVGQFVATVHLFLSSGELMEAGGRLEELLFDRTCFNSLSKHKLISLLSDYYYCLFVLPITGWVVVVDDARYF